MGTAIEHAARGRDQDIRDGWGFEESDEIYPGRHALKLLGGGRRYEAYLAFDESLLTTVVVKILRPSRIRDPRSLEGLAGELTALQGLNHPVIGRAFGGVLEGERPHICLEFLEGPRLSTLLRKFGSLPLEQLVPLGLQLSSALHYMHGSGMVHLDVKPKNIIMGAPPRLIDLSIARSFDEARALDVQVGTDAYMAPEQCAPLPGRIGSAADIWALGVTLQESASGRRPFVTDPHERHPQLHRSPRPLASDVPRDLAQLIDSCLRRDPSDRPTAREVTDRLEPLAAALPRRIVLSRLKPKLR